MMYPFLTLEDDTEIVHSEVLPNETVRVYIEKPTENGFKSAYCVLPDYTWSEIRKYSDDEIQEHQKILESLSHLIIEFAREGGFNRASGL